jgi:hypothetical protein
VATDSFANELFQATLTALPPGDRQRIALIGATPAALTVRSLLAAAGLSDRVAGIFDPAHGTEGLPQGRAWRELSRSDASILIFCADADKEKLLRACAAIFDGAGDLPRVVLAGTEHLNFRDPDYAMLDAPALVPSYATGYPLTRVHLFQCLQAAAAQKLSGSVVEFGAFKVGTTVWLAKVVKHFGIDAEVIGFDSWAGFPRRRSLLDLYEHPRCVFDDLAAASAYAEPYGVSLVPGDIADTCEVLRDKPIVLAFVDTDNYSGARAALEVCGPQVVRGGAIVLDHYWTTSEYIYTVGERMAASEVLSDLGFMNLQGTGVFTKLATGS